MATLRVPEDYATLQDAVNAAAASGDEIIVAPGSLSSPGSAQLIDFRSSVTGTAFTDLRLISRVDYGAVLDLDGLTSRGFRCAGNGVRFEGFTIQGTPDAGPVWEDDTEALDSWVWHGLRFQDMTVAPFALSGQLGSSMELSGIEVMASVVAPTAIDLRNPGTGSWDLLLDDIDIRGVSGSFGTAGVYLRDMRGVTLRRVWVYDADGAGIWVDARTAGRGCVDVTLREPRVLRAGGAGIVAGDSASGEAWGSKVASSAIRVYGAQVQTCTGPGLELGPGVVGSDIDGGEVRGCGDNLRLGSEAQRCTVRHLVSRNPTGGGVHFRHRNAVDCEIERNTAEGAGTVLRVELEDGPTLLPAGMEFQRNVVHQATTVYDLDTWGADGAEFDIRDNVYGLVNGDFARVPDDWPTASIITGRVRMAEDRSGNLGQEGAPHSYTDEQLDLYAQAELGYLQLARALTSSGQAFIAAVLERNPRFRWVGYVQFMHCPASDPGAARPLNSDQYALHFPKRARHLDGAYVQAFPDPAGPNPIQAWWASGAVSIPGGETFDKPLMDDWMNAIRDRIAAVSYKPIGFKLDYFRPPALGPFVWPSEETAHGKVDANQDGTPHDADAVEQQAFEDAQLYFITGLRSRMGNHFILTANGNASWPGEEAALQALLDGFYMEDFPVTPWWKPYDAFDKLWQWHSGAEPYRALFGRNGFVHTDVDPLYGEGSSRANAARCAALLFDIWYRYPVYDNNSVLDSDKLNQPTWQSWVATLGAPTAAPGRGTNGTQTTYSRTFEGGLVVVTVDGSLSGISQLVTAGIF